MKRRAHGIAMAAIFNRNIGTIGTIGTIKTIKNLLKKTPAGCTWASFRFVNTQEQTGRSDKKSAKGHLSHFWNFYFESCVCQKKRKKHPDFREKSVERKSFSLSINDGLYMHSVVSAHVITRQFISSHSRQPRYRIREEYSTPRIPFPYSVSENDSINTATPVLPMRNTQSCV